MKKILNCIILTIFSLSVVFSINWYRNNEYRDYFNFSIEKCKTHDWTTEYPVTYGRVEKPGNYTLSFDYKLSCDHTVQCYDSGSFSLENNGFKNYYTRVIPAGSGRFSASFAVDTPTDEFDVSLTCNDNDLSVREITNLNISSDEKVYKDNFFFCIFFIGFFAVCYVSLAYILNSRANHSEKCEMFFVLCGLVIIFLISAYPYFFTVYPDGHDLNFHFNRITGLSHYFTNGNIGIHRINNAFNSSYGYISPIMYPELFLYIPGLLAALGMSVMGAFKLFIFIINIATVIISYFSFSRMTSNKYGGLLITAIYCLSVYRLVNIYYRMALGEVLFMAFLPLAIYGLYSVFYEKNRLSQVYLCLGVTGIIQSHILGIILCAICLIVYLIVLTIKALEDRTFSLKPYFQIASSAVFTIGLNLWFLVPFLYYYITQPLKLFPADKGMDVLAASEILSLFSQSESMPKNMGLLLLFAIAINLLYSLYLILTGKNIISECINILSIFASMLFTASLSFYSKMLTYQLLSDFLNRFQFSFRFYSVLLIVICYVSAHHIKSFCARVKHKDIILKTLVVLALCFSVVSSYDIFVRNSIYSYDSKNNKISTAAPSEYFMEGTSYSKEQGKYKKVEESENIIITSYQRKDMNINLSYKKTDENSGSIKLPLYYYHGYVRVNSIGEKLPVFAGENGTILVTLSETVMEDKINIYFDSDIPIFRYPEYISALFFLLLCGYILKCNYPLSFK